MIPLERGRYHHEISVAHPRLGVRLEMSGGQYLPQHLLHTRLDDMQFPLVGNLHHLSVNIHAGDLHPVRSLEAMTVLERSNAMGPTMLLVPHEPDCVRRFSKRGEALKEGELSGGGEGGY